MSVRYLKCRAALKNQCKQAEGVSAALPCKSTASWLGQSQDISFSWMNMLIPRDWRTHKFPQCENGSCWGVSCINSVHVHRWCGCPLAVGREKGAISTQMHLIASTLSWLAAGLWNDQMLWPGSGACAGAGGHLDAASGNRNCQGRLGVCSCVVLFCFLCLFGWSVAVLCLCCWCGSVVAWSSQLLSLNRNVFHFKISL